MSFHSIVNNAYQRTRQGSERLLAGAGSIAARRPGMAIVLLLGTGIAIGGGAGLAATAELRAQVAQQQAQVEATRRDAQREINALAARLGELQAEANRLNALGERLTRIGQLQDGEFDFEKPVGIGGTGPIQDMPRTELIQDMERLDHQFEASGEQLSVLESLLFNRQLDMNSVPSREPINSYITSSFGRRADPIRGGRQFHKGIDFEADVGDPVIAVADGARFFHNWWVGLFPGLAIFMTVLAANFLSDSLRDRLDPKLARNVR